MTLDYSKLSLLCSLWPLFIHYEIRIPKIPNWLWQWWRTFFQNLFKIYWLKINLLILSHHLLVFICIYVYSIFSFILEERVTQAANPSSENYPHIVTMLQCFPNILSSLFYNRNFDYPMKKKAKHNVMDFHIKLSI